MARIWSEEAKLRAVARGGAGRARRPGRSSASCRPTRRIGARARAAAPSPERVAEIERETGHDVAAFVDAVAETLGSRRPLVPLRPDLLGRGRHGPRAGRPARRARSCSRARAGASRPSCAAPRSTARRSDDRPHARHPRRADDVRPQARRLGVRARARPCACSTAALEGLRVGQALRRGRHVRGGRPRGRARSPASGSASSRPRRRRR